MKIIQFEELEKQHISRNFIWQMGIFVVIFISFITAFSVKDVYALLDHDKHFVWYIFTGCVIAVSLIWFINVLIHVYRLVDKFIKPLAPITHFWIRAIISLILGQLVVLAWAFIDYQLKIESKYDPDFILSVQFRGLFFSAFCLAIMYSIEKTNEQREAINQVLKLKEETFQAKYEVLKQQVNPHFLFNSLNILKGMIRTHNDYAEEYLIKLAEVYRYILQSNTKNEVIVADELAMIEAYFYMLQKRFPEAIEFSVKLSKKALQSHIPPLTFQLLMENSVKHNVISKNKKLIIKLFDKQDKLYFLNNFQFKPALDSSNHVGLQNLNTRYKYLCNKEIEVVNDGISFFVKLPLISVK